MKRLTVKQQMKLYKEYNKQVRVAAYKNETEESLEFIEPGMLPIGREDLGFDTINGFLETLNKALEDTNIRLDELQAENKKLHETIHLLLGVKGD